ncbi:hypothetical protein KIL84_020765 [Mauremys mutica]|uniref:peptidylprolyl isomerase n=2 Tax=Mauremys TaxID=74925 RepID=A0A9D3XA95_9SAUR|nr:hypothetical protein KIL84_020765 [Mauremys mutica]
MTGVAQTMGAASRRGNSWHADPVALGASPTAQPTLWPPAAPCGAGWPHTPMLQGNGQAPSQLPTQLDAARPGKANAHRPAHEPSAEPNLSQLLHPALEPGTAERDDWGLQLAGAVGLSLVAPPEDCAARSALGDTVEIHYTGSLEDGQVIDTSLSRDPLQVELGKRQVIPGLEQSLLDMCVGEKRRVIIPPQLAYGKRGSPPAVPADAVLQFDVELVGLSRASYWQKLTNDVLPLLCIGLIPALLGLIGYHLYHKASSSRGAKKRLKEEKRNKAKKK